MPFPERVETPRLVLRRWRADDREAIGALYADRDVWRALRPGSPFDPAFAAARLEAHLAHWEAHGFGVWAAEERASAELVGAVGASHPAFVPELAGRVEIGWALRRPYRGRGLATEGARAAVAAAFAALGVDELISLIEPGNLSSVAVAERLVMRATRVVRHRALEVELCVYARPLRLGGADARERSAHDLAAGAAERGDAQHGPSERRPAR